MLFSVGQILLTKPLLHSKFFVGAGFIVSNQEGKMKKLILGLLVGFVILPIICFAQLWVARYNGPANSYDKAYAIAVDDSGNVYVTGESYGSGTSNDYATIKYNSSGDTVWVRRYNGPDSLNDEASAIAVDDSGNVYVTGWSKGSGTEYDYATIKYNSSGIEQWEARYNGPGNWWDKAYAIAVDDSGNVYVTGESDGASFMSAYATIKYNSSGDTVWVRRYVGPGESIGEAHAIAVDRHGNVYVTGKSDGPGTYNDYVTVKYNTAGVEQWVARYNGTGNWDDFANAISVDKSGNVYITGYSEGLGTDDDYVTVKYNSSGVEEWVARYNGPGNKDDEASAIAIDGFGNVYVTGYSYDSDANYGYATVKYNTVGVEQWVRRYNGPSNSGGVAYAIAVDGNGNIYVTGHSRGSGYWKDYATVKYNSSGDSLWVRRYNGPGNDEDRAYAIAVDGEYVYVAGYSRGLGTKTDYATIKYSCAGVEERNERLEIRDYRLQIYPNPFTTMVRVQWSGVSEGERVSLKIYDLSGRLVKRLLNNEVIPGNKIEVRLEELTNGIYFVKMEARDFKATKKLTIIR